jgi:serine/threonine protein kinase
MTGRGDVRSSAPQLDTSRGSTDLGRYQVFATLGRGGMAEVFLAVARGPRGFNKLVVLKRLRPHLAEEASFREMFLDEARLAARLNHANVVQSYEVGEGNGSYFIAMEYLEGQPLNRVAEEASAQGQRLEAPLAIRIIAEACAGLAHAHELRDYDGTSLRIIHRDISPHNIFVTYDGQVKLVDFGIAKAAVSRAETEVGVLKGKIAYMAPEQATGEGIDSRADLFAMGIVLWELLTGRALFGGENAAHTLQRLVNEPIPRPSSALPAEHPLDPKLETIVMKALEKEPAERFQTARELRAALEDWLRENAPSVRGEDVSNRMASLFENTRAGVQAEIQKQMVALAAGEAASTLSLSSLDALEKAGQNVRAALLDLGSRTTSTTSGTNRKIDVRPGASRRRGLLAALLLLLACAAALVVFLLVRPGSRSDRAPSQTPVVVASVTAPEPPAAFATPSPPPPASPPPPTAPAATDPAPAPLPVASAVPASRARVGIVHSASAHGVHASRGASAPSPGTVAADTGPGYLTLDTYPWTRVSENGRVLGTTPLVHVALTPGQHTLALENSELGIRQTYQATIVSGATATRRLGLR